MANMPPKHINCGFQVFPAFVEQIDVCGKLDVSRCDSGIHNQDVYWTGEKIVTAPERFRTILAIHDSKVVGYQDVTKGFEENEIFDLFILEDYRRMGYGRKLLAMAIKMNQPNGMMLTVNVDNILAIRLYESVGFWKVENENSVAACWIMREG